MKALKIFAGAGAIAGLALVMVGVGILTRADGLARGAVIAAVGLGVLGASALVQYAITEREDLLDLLQLIRGGGRENDD